jgi:hypothetical protein
MRSLFILFNRRIFIIIFVILLIGVFGSSMIAFSIEDGAMPDNSINRLRSLPIIIFSYLAGYFDNMFFYFFFLILQVALVSVILERIIYLVKILIKKQFR